MKQNIVDFLKDNNYQLFYQTESKYISKRLCDFLKTKKNVIDVRRCSIKVLGKNNKEFKNKFKVFIKYKE